ncbi:MAG TPA: metallophosphoesterase family protein [Bryobacteraceae bacterium]|nr:metallophosphoesterase family protein [Bryobacteraceae bacterium]
MPYLILSDIHGNLEALEAVLADAEGYYDRVLCLGDLVGYGADPNAVVAWARENVAAIVRGNHDRVCIGLEPVDTYNAAAQASAHWTQAELTPAHRDYLERLPRGPLPYHGVDLVHGSPADEDEYLLSVIQVPGLQPFLERQVTFFGHTHIQGGFLMARRGTRVLMPSVALTIEPDYFYLVNPGSVGQPRDRDPRAAYALYSPVERTVEFRRAAYDANRAAAKIRAAGLPEFLAARLQEGV